MSKAFERLTLFEADGLALAMVEWPVGNAERYALVMERRDIGVRLYFFLDKLQVHDLVEELVELVGEDA